MIEQTQKKTANFDLSSIEMLDLGDSLFSEPGNEPDGKKYIVFFLDTDAYAIPSTRVAEIFQPLAITSLQNTPEWLVGIANFRNEIISVIDLPVLLKKGSSPLTQKSKLIVLRPEDSESPVAFVIDRLSEMMAISDSSIEPVSDENSPYICGRTDHKSNQMHVLDTTKLLASLSL